MLMNLANDCGKTSAFFCNFLGKYNHFREPPYHLLWLRNMWTLPNTFLKSARVLANTIAIIPDNEVILAYKSLLRNLEAYGFQGNKKNLITSIKIMVLWWSWSNYTYYLFGSCEDICRKRGGEFSFTIQKKFPVIATNGWRPKDVYSRKLIIITPSWSHSVKGNEQILGRVTMVFYSQNWWYSDLHRWKQQGRGKIND